MTVASASPSDVLTLRWRIGALLICLSLLGGGFVLSSLAFSPSVVVLHGLLKCYLPVYGSVLLCSGVFVCPPEVRWSIDTRICGLCCLLLSPFATWSITSTGNTFLSVNCILWQFFALGCLRMVLRLYASECFLRGFLNLANFFQAMYWLFLITVFAPFCARALDVFWFSYAYDAGPIQVSNLWQSPFPLLDIFLRSALLVGVFETALCSLFVILRFRDEPVQAETPSEESESTSSKEQESNGDDIDSGAGCVQ